MGVDLGGVEPLVAEDGLGHAEVAGGLDQLGGHGVAEGVGRDARREPGGFPVALDEVLEGADREGGAEPGHQERGPGGGGKAAGLIEPQQGGNRLPRAGVEGDEPSPAPLAQVSGKIEHFSRGAPVSDIRHREAADF